MYTSIEATAKAWQVFREGIAPQLTSLHLQVLREGLRSSDPALLRGATTHPGFLGGLLKDSPCRGACPVGYMGLVADELPTVGHVVGFFERVLMGCDKRLGLMAHAHFVEWWDHAPETTARVELAMLLDAILEERAVCPVVRIAPASMPA